MAVGSVGFEGEKKVFAFLGGAAFVVEHAVAEEVIDLRFVAVAAEAEAEAGEFADFPLEEVADVVVELLRGGLGVHGHDGAGDFGRERLAVGTDVGEVGDGGGVVVLEGVGIEAEEMGVAGVEAEIGVAEDPAVGVGPGSEAVVVADEDHVGHAELFEDVALELELVGEAEVADVAAVDHEVHVGAEVDALHGGAGLVVPALGVADEHELHLLLAAAALLDLRDVVAVAVVRPAGAGVVGVDVDEVAGGEAEGRGRHPEEFEENFGKAFVFHSAKIEKGKQGTGKTEQVFKVFKPAPRFFATKLPVFGAPGGRGGEATAAFKIAGRAARGAAGAFQIAGRARRGATAALLSLLLPHFGGVSDDTARNPGCRSLRSLALGWVLLPLL